MLFTLISFSSSLFASLLAIPPTSLVKGVVSNANQSSHTHDHDKLAFNLIHPNHFHSILFTHSILWIIYLCIYIYNHNEFITLFLQSSLTFYTNNTSHNKLLFHSPSKHSSNAEGVNLLCILCDVDTWCIKQGRRVMLPLFTCIHKYSIILHFKHLINHHLWSGD